MKAFDLSSVPHYLKEEIYKKMDIVSFTRMRRTCKSIHDHIDKERKKLNVYYELKFFDLERFKTVIHKPSGAIRGSRRRARIDPVELTGVYIHHFRINLYRYAWSWLKKFAEAVDSRRVRCGTIQICPSTPLQLLKVILQTFGRVDSLYIFIWEPCNTEMLSFPVIQSVTKFLQIQISECRLDLIPTNCLSFVIAVRQRLNMKKIGHFLKSLKNGTRRVNRCKLLFSHSKEDTPYFDMYDCFIAPKLGLIPVWFEADHMNSCLKDTDIDSVLFALDGKCVHKMPFEDKFYYIAFSPRMIAIRVFKDDQEFAAKISDWDSDPFDFGSVGLNDFPWGCPFSANNFLSESDELGL